MKRAFLNVLLKVIINSDNCNKPIMLIEFNKVYCPEDYVGTVSEGLCRYKDIFRKFVNSLLDFLPLAV